MSNNLLALLGNVLDDKNIEAISGALGAENKNTKKGIAAALPELLAALGKNSSNPESMGNLEKALSKDHDGSILSNIGKLVKDPDASKGGKILDHIFAGGTQTVASSVAKKTGLSEDQAQKLLKTLGPIVMGSLGKAKKDGNLSTSDLGNLLSQSSGASGLFVQFLDHDGDGDFDKSDMLSMGINFVKKKFFGGK